MKTTMNRNCSLYNPMIPIIIEIRKQARCPIKDRNGVVDQFKDREHHGSTSLTRLPHFYHTFVHLMASSLVSITSFTCSLARNRTHAFLLLRLSYPALSQM